MFAGIPKPLSRNYSVRRPASPVDLRQNAAGCQKQPHDMDGCITGQASIQFCTVVDVDVVRAIDPLQSIGVQVDGYYRQ